MNKIKATYWAYRNKITNKFFGIVRMPSLTKRKGYVLLSYFTEPFTFTPWKPFPNYHTMYWECYEIARLFGERGYEVDIINTKDHKFIPRKKYSVCIDAEDDMERLIKYLPVDCKKVFHILISYWQAYNNAEEKRLRYLKERRGVTLLPRRKVNPSRDAELADFLEGFGNKTIFSTFKQFNKPIFFIPISAVIHYDFPEQKDFSNAKKHFIWMGGGGAVLKGLDLALEAFAKMPDLHLHVCGPIYGEKDFTDEYKKELKQTQNIHVYGRLDVAGEKFLEILSKCSAVVYPTGGEGSSGAIVQAMHAGLIPIITHETGIQEDSEFIELNKPGEIPSPESISKIIRDFSNKSEDEIKSKSKKIWEYARAKYTRDEFTKAYSKFID